MIPRIEIKTKGINAQVLVNGEELQNVRSIRFSQNAGELPIVSVDYVAADLYLDGEFVPALPHPFEEWYQHKEAPPCEGEANEH